MTLLPNTLIFFVEKNERSFCTAKASHNFSTKNIGKFKILTFEILTFETLTNDVVSFEQNRPRCGFSLSYGRGEPCLACQYIVRLCVLLQGPKALRA